jgi:hypothetical protein
MDANPAKLGVEYCLREKVVRGMFEKLPGVENEDQTPVE